METKQEGAEALKWVKSKAGRSSIIERFASPQLFPEDEDPYAIFMAGSPGAGKTEVSKTLIQTFGVPIVHIDADAIREVLPQYNSKNADVIQGAAALGVEKLYDSVLKKGQHFILDGTFSTTTKAVNNVARALDHKRGVVIIYVYQEPEVAWRFTKKRELTEGRSVPQDVFVGAYFAARKNVNEVKRVYGNSVQLYAILKNYENSVEQVFQNVSDVDSCIPERYSDSNLIDICTRPLSE